MNDNFVFSTFKIFHACWSRFNLRKLTEPSLLAIGMQSLWNFLAERKAL